MKWNLEILKLHRKKSEHILLFSIPFALIFDKIIISESLSPQKKRERFYTATFAWISHFPSFVEKISSFQNQLLKDTHHFAYAVRQTRKIIRRKSFKKYYFGKVNIISDNLNDFFQGMFNSNILYKFYEFSWKLCIFYSFENKYFKMSAIFFFVASLFQS